MFFNVNSKLLAAYYEMSSENLDTKDALRCGVVDFGFESHASCMLTISHFSPFNHMMCISNNLCLCDLAGFN